MTKQRPVSIWLNRRLQDAIDEVVVKRQRENPYQPVSRSAVVREALVLFLAAQEAGNAGREET